MGRRRAAGALLALLLGGVLSAVPAVAQEADLQQRRDELGLSVEVGFAGRGREASWQPVAVGLEPARPLAGTLSVAVREAGTAENLEVEVAAASRKVYRFVVPPGRIEVTFTEEGEEPLSVQPGGAPATGEYMVGVLGGAAEDLAAVPPLRSEFTGQSGAWVPVDPAWLDVSAQALDPLGTVVVDTAALQALAPPAAANLASAVAAGTDIVVVGGDTADLRSLGLPWEAPAQPWEVTLAALGTARGSIASTGADTPLATAFAAGAGRVITTDVAPGAPGPGRSSEFWSLVAQPSTKAPVAPADYRVTSAPHQFSRLLADADAQTPALPGLGAFVLVYVLVVGPVNAIVLARMGRRELAWATIPMITAVFTIGAFVGATAARPESGGVARLTYWTDGPGTEFVAAGVRAPTPGERTVTLPGSEWTVRVLADGGDTAFIDRGGDTTVSMNLTALQLGGVAAWRSVDTPPPLEVRAQAHRGGVDVTIRNTSGQRINDVAVRSATTTRSLGTLAPGRSDTLTIAAPRLAPGRGYGDPFDGLRVNRNGAVAAPQSMRAVLNTEVIQGRPGTLWVSGITGAQPLGVNSGGAALRDRGAMVAVGATVENTGGGLSPFAVARDAFFDPQATYPVGPTAVEGNGELFLRYRLPPGATAAQLTDQMTPGAQGGGNAQLTVWDHVNRQWINLTDGFAPASRPRLVGPLGEVWVRASGGMFPFDYGGRTIAGQTP